jgi:hypothetical protein
MFPFPIATPQGCNIQTFYGFGTNTGNSSQRTWSKPVGVSHVYIMLIGSGGTGSGTNGGGSGAVTVWYGAAQHVPDRLYVVATGQGSQSGSQIYFDQSQVYVLLTAEGGLGSSAGAATTAGPFAASGFYKSTAGQGGALASVTASTTTFLSGGADAVGDTVTANYGYFVPGNGAGFFQMQPIIVGAGGSANGRGGIGCGGGGDSTGGPGMVLIASW